MLSKVAKRRTPPRSFFLLALREEVRIVGINVFSAISEEQLDPIWRELSLTIFNGKKFKQTIEAHDRGFRGDPGSTGTSSKRAGVAFWPGSRRKRAMFPQYKES